MSALIIDGKQIARDIRNKVKLKVTERVNNGLSTPGLATILVGDNPASKVYVKAKHKACEEAGILSFSHNLPDDASQETIEALVKNLNADANIHGILVQLPLPPGLDEEKILSTINLEKDVDGFHPVNIGRLAQKGREPLFVPCTPAGIMVLLESA